LSSVRRIFLLSSCTCFSALHGAAWNQAGRVYMFTYDKGVIMKHQTESGLESDWPLFSWKLLNYYFQDAKEEGGPYLKDELAKRRNCKTIWSWFWKHKTKHIFMVSMMEWSKIFLPLITITKTCFFCYKIVLMLTLESLLLE
jgi:hypothetical protein